MTKDYYLPIECGETLPLNNPHAFSVSMPTVQDVIDYEEETTQIKEIIKTAYPRIVFHPYINKIVSLATKELVLGDKYLFLLPNLEVAKRVERISKTKCDFLEYKGYTLAIFHINDKENIKKYYNLMKHCGYMIFSREAEDFLVKENNHGVFKEDYYNGDSRLQITSVLEEGYETKDILITNCGMNAIYSGYEAVKSLMAEEGKEIVIQYGWAYSDTLQIFQKCTKRLMIIEDVSNTAKLEKFLEKKGDQVGILYLETISNPLIAVPDIPRIYTLAKKYGFKVLVDNTFATPWCVDINKHCDLIFESLTKYASGHGDIMAGAVIRPKGSSIDTSIMKAIEEYTLPLYPRVAKRLAFTIGDYKNRVELVESNCSKVVDYFSDHPMVERIYTTQEFKQNWDKIARDGYRYGGVVSIVFKGELDDVYNNLNLPKGPSLGSEFHLVMPYTLLAHYFDTKTKYGLSYLKKVGLSPNLLRFSIGTHSVDYILNSEVLKKS